MKIQPQFNIRKAVTYVIVINALQILAVLALAVFILHDGVNQSLRGPLGDVVVVMLAAVVSWGAVMDIREAYQASKMSVKLSGLDETVNQMSDLNIALRAQRHDFLNHLQVVYSLIEMEEYQEANRYIEQVYGDIQSVSQALKTACAPVNALLRAKMAEAKQRGVEVELQVHAVWDKLPIASWEMCRVLSNLMDNAMDALEGTANSSLRIMLREDTHGFAFSVANNGPMIPAEKLQSIFEPGVSSHGEGRGMGLYIVRGTLQKYGGEIHVTSEVGRTIFSGLVPHRKERNGKETQGA